LDAPEANPDPARRPRRPRRFTLLDSVVMVAALAIGQRGYMAMMTVYEPSGIDSPWPVIASIRRSGFLGAPFHVLFWFNAAAPFLLSLATALCVLRRLSPRPARPRLRRQPGALAMTAAAFAAAFVFASWGLFDYPLHRAGILVAKGVALSTQYTLPFRTTLAAMVASGAAVAGGWAGLILDRSSLKGGDWIEWSGRALGASLMLATPFYLWALMIMG
jgi:hypothetical protein